MTPGPVVGPLLIKSRSVVTYVLVLWGQMIGGVCCGHAVEKKNLGLL